MDIKSYFLSTVEEYDASLEQMQKHSIFLRNFQNKSFKLTTEIFYLKASISH
jgi:hypothetical protein